MTKNTRIIQHADMGFRWPICRTCDIFLNDRDRAFPRKCSFAVGDSIPHYVAITSLSSARWDQLAELGYRRRIKHPNDVPREI